MIIYYTPPAITSPIEVAPTTTAIPRAWFQSTPLPGRIWKRPPLSQMHHIPLKGEASVKHRALTPVPITAVTHVSQKGRPSPSWLQASGFPSGVLAANGRWHPNKWVSGGKAPLYKAAKDITGLPVELGVGVAGDAPVSWPMQSRLSCLYTVARQVGVIIEIMPHTVRIVSG